MRYVPGSRVGIHVGESWYCSPDCFAMASRATLSALTAGHVVEMPRNPRLSLGLALLSKGYLNEDQLRSAMLRTRRQGQNLENTLIDCGLVNDKQLAAARAVQWGIPVLGQDLVIQTVVMDLPRGLLSACGAVPIHYTAKTKRLVLGFVGRVDHSLLQSIEQITGCRPEPCFITSSEFAQQFDTLASPQGYEEVVVEDTGSAADMARTLGGFAVEVSAREAGYVRCHSSVWARLTGNRGTVDIIFALRRPVMTDVTTNSMFSHEISEVVG
jgi:hypothetical protein